MVASLCNQLLVHFSSNQFETLLRWYKHIEVRLQHMVASLCNQLLVHFSSNQFETLLRWYKHIEDLRVIFADK